MPFYPPIITVELPVKTNPSLGAMSPNTSLIYSTVFVMKFVIGFADSVTDKSNFNPRSTANSPPILTFASKSSKSKYPPPFAEIPAASRSP